MDESSDQNVVAASFAMLRDLRHAPNALQIVKILDDLDLSAENNGDLDRN